MNGEIPLTNVKEMKNCYMKIPVKTKSMVILNDQFEHLKREASYKIIM